MDTTPVHFHKSNIHSSSNLHLLFIPAIIFALIIAVYILTTSRKYTQIATIEHPTVLGEEKELDIKYFSPQNIIR